MPSRHDPDQTPRRKERPNTVADTDTTPRGKGDVAIKHVVRKPSMESGTSTSSYSESAQHSLRHQASVSSARSGRSGLELQREGSWISLSKEAEEAKSLTPPSGHPREISPSVDTSDSPSPLPVTPSPPSKSPLMGLKNDLAEEKGATLSSLSLKGTLLNMKRFSSLPRTPSRASIPSPSSERLESPSPSYAPSVVTPIRVVPRKRIRAAWPLAMQCYDVVAKKSPLERAMGYAEKINELSMYDCGLAEWVMYRHRGV